MHVAFVDCEKAWATLAARHQQDIYPSYIKVKEDTRIYTSSIATAKLQKGSHRIPLRKVSQSVSQTHDVAVVGGT